MTHDQFYRPILSAINLAVELGSNFAEKIGGFYRSSVIGFNLQTITITRMLSSGREGVFN